MSRKRVYNIWPKESVDWAMSLKGTMSQRAAERETGIPARTIQGWWAGTSDPYRGPGQKSGAVLPKRDRCKRGHRYTENNVHIHSTNGRRECLTCYRMGQRRSYYRRKNKYHPTLNPDPMLAPINQLWFRGPDLFAEALQSTTYSEVYAAADPATQRIMSAIRYKERYWVSYHAADRLCAVIGFPVSALCVQPEHIGHPTAKEAA